MKKIKMIRIFTLLLITIGTMSCKKETLTKATQIGANTFSCKVNGVIHIPNNEAFGARAISTSLSKNENPISYNIQILTNFSRKEPSENVYLTIYKVNEIGVYKMSGSEFRFGTYILGIPNGLGGIKYTSKTFNDGEVNITKLDLVNRIVSGTFWFEATIDNNPNEKVSITDGRFDLKI